MLHSLFTKVLKKELYFHKSANRFDVVKVESSHDGSFLLQKIKPDFLSIGCLYTKPIRATNKFYKTK